MLRTYRGKLSAQSTLVDLATLFPQPSGDISQLDIDTRIGLWAERNCAESVPALYSGWRADLARFLLSRDTRRLRAKTR